MNDYSTLQFVDSVPNLVGSNNLLFRGGMPTDNGSFDLLGLHAAFCREHPGTPDLYQYYLVDISLVYDGDNGLAAERQFFSENFNVGQLVWWPTVGSLRCYYKTDAREQDRLVGTLDEWLPDTLIRRTETLRYMLETSWVPGATLAGPPFGPPWGPPWQRSGIWPGYRQPPFVFYVHCDGGCDRTSQMIGAYRLRYQDYDWLRMYGEHPCGRPMGCSNYRALQWYAIWLNKMFDFKLEPHGDGGCSDPSPPAPANGQPWPACSP
jgi:hypothetical protein